MRLHTSLMVRCRFASGKKWPNSKVGEALDLLSSADIVPGALCGSTCINERYEKLVIEKLGDEHYLWQDGMDMSRFIDRLVVAFERTDKKKLDGMFPDNITRYSIRVPGLRANKRKNFFVNNLCLTR